MQDIRVWLSRDKLFMNDKKTEFLVIGTRQQLKKVSIDCLTIGAEDSWCVVRQYAVNGCPHY